MTKTRFLTGLFLVLTLLSFGTPFLAQATGLELEPEPSEISNGLVPCGTTANPTPCKFDDIFKLINNIIKFILYYSVPVAAISIVVAGLFWIWGAMSGKTALYDRARKTLWNIVLGYILILASFLIVSAIVSLFIEDSVLRQIDARIEL